MTALLIIACVIALLMLLLLLPVTVDLKFRDELCLRIKYAGIPLFDTERKYRHKAPKKPKKAAAEPKERPKKENFFEKLKREKGFLGAVKYCFALLGIILKRCLWLIKKLKFRHFYLDLTVSTENAANTAIEYGSVCAVVYPVLALLHAAISFKSDKINISSDFDKVSPELAFSFSVSTRIIYAFIAVITAFIQYTKLKKDEENERK